MNKDKSLKATQQHQTFESIKKIAGEDEEFWLARDLQRVLDYSSYRTTCRLPGFNAFGLF